MPCRKESCSTSNVVAMTGAPLAVSAPPGVDEELPDETLARREVGAENLLSTPAKPVEAEGDISDIEVTAFAGDLALLGDDWGESRGTKSGSGNVALVTIAGVAAKGNELRRSRRGE